MVHVSNQTTASRVATIACVSGLANRMLFAFEEYFGSAKGIRVHFIRQLAGDSAFAKELYEHKEPVECMRAILTFLQRGVRGTGLQERINQPRVDCARFCLRALDSLAKAPPSFAKQEKNFWEVYAALGVGAFERSRARYIPVKPEAILHPLVRKFRGFRGAGCWELRAGIINGFKGIAREFTKRDKAFWEACEFFVKYWEGATKALKGRLPKPIWDGVVDLVDTWRILARMHGRNKTVQRRTVGVALTLLKLIDRAELPFNLGLERLNESLFALQLDQVDPWGNEKLRRDRRTQAELEGVANGLVKLSERFKGRPEEHWLREILSTLLPYLRGYTATRDRRRPVGSYSDCSVQLDISGQLEGFAAHLNDICAQAFRAFDIDVSGISLDKDYNVLKNYRGKRVGRMPCRQVRVKQIGSDRFDTVKKMILTIRYQKVPGRDAKAVIPCRILRATRVSGNRSRFVVWAPKGEFKQLPKGWKSYVTGLLKE